MTTFIFFLIGFSSADALPSTHHLEFEPLPEESELYLEYPVGVAVDAQGRVLVLDVVAKAVFVWGPQGKFEGHFGKQGYGPGEFSFDEFNSKQAQIDCHGDRIYIYESGKRLVHIFKSDFTFIGAKGVEHGVGAGRTRFFGLTNAQTFLMHHQDYSLDKPISRLMLYDKDMNPAKTLLTYPDRLYTAKERANSDRRLWTINVFAPKLTLFSDSFRGLFLAGTGKEPAFDVYNAAGEKLKTVRFTGKRDSVTDQDKDEYTEQKWFKESSSYRATFPDRFPYYEKVCTIKDKGYLVYRASPLYGRISGLVIDSTGQTIGPFRYNCGENGSIYGSAGRVIAVKTDEIGDYQIVELTIPVQ